MLKDVEKMTGQKHRLMWISRGDSKVRRVHRQIHGSIRPHGMPFWSSKVGELRFPGDPLAPLGQTINCRCVLFLVPKENAVMVSEALKAQRAEFDEPLTSSGTPGCSRAEADLQSELAVIYAPQ